MRIVDSDLELLDRWCSGDSNAGNDLFQRHFDSIYQFFKHKIEHDIDELVQRTFMACVSSRDKFRRQCSFRTYLFTIARNELYQYLRRKRHAGRAIDFNITSLVDLRTTPGIRVARHEQQMRLLHALRSLPLELQLLLELHYWEGMNSSELAEVFEIAATTARTRLHRARHALRERMDELATEPLPVQTSIEDLEAWAQSLRRRRPGDNDSGAD